MNPARIIRKLEAIERKDLDRIFAAHPPIPLLPANYTRQQLDTWRGRFVTILEFCREHADDDITLAQAQQFYSDLTAQQKAVVDTLLDWVR